MHDMPMMTESMCGASASWMQMLTYIGFYSSVFFAGFYALRLTVRAFLNSSVDRADSSSHLLMFAGMAYMFMPMMSWHVIPDLLWALVFALLALALSLSMAMKLRRDLFLSELLHVLMNLGMVYMFVGSVWSSPILNLLFVATYAAYGTFHISHMVASVHKMKFESASLLIQIESVFAGLSHLAMAAGMLIMVLMPMSMALS